MFKTTYNLGATLPRDCPERDTCKIILTRVSQQWGAAYQRGLIGDAVIESAIKAEAFNIMAAQVASCAPDTMQRITGAVGFMLYSIKREDE